MNNRTYDSTKWVAQIALPAVGALYFGLAQIWGFPSGEEVVGTITIVDTFLGVLLGISTKTYNQSDAAHDGFIESSGADPDTGMQNLRMTITSTPDELLAAKTVRLKVGKPKVTPEEH